MSAPLLVLAAGGTGGHMFPAQALAEEMVSIGWSVKLSTDKRGARYAKNFPSEVEVSVIKSATFSAIAKSYVNLFLSPILPLYVPLICASPSKDLKSCL